MVALKYINKNAATIAAIRDYNNMRFIINNTSQEIKEVYEKMASPMIPMLSGMPSVRNPQAGANKLVAQLDKLDILRERYSQALEFMSWFEPAWSSLTDTEQHILSEFYLGDKQNSGATYRLMDELSYSESHVERLRSQAVSHLGCLLYG